MMNKKKNIILLSVLVVVLLLALIFIYIDVTSDGSLDILMINKEGNVTEEVMGENNSINEEEQNSSDKENDVSDSEIANDTIDEDNLNSGSYSEEDVVSYFEEMESEVEDSSSFKDKFKEYFITIIDFIFYDVEIKGYTFDSLSGMAKVKIIGIALKIDSNIEEYIPNYKESISSTSSRVYTDVKGKLVTLYLDISTDICKNNEEECVKVKDIFGEIKDVCKIGWDFVKELALDGVSKVREWYEIYSGK